MEKINTFINIIAGIAGIVSAIKTWGLRKQTEELRDEISNRRDSHDIVLNLRYCCERVGRLPARHLRGVEIDAEIVEIRKLMSVVS